MAFRWIYSVSLFFFTVQGGLILRPTTLQSHESAQPVSAIDDNSEWFAQLDVIGQRCTDDPGCQSLSGSLLRDCLATCLRSRLESSPIIRKTRKTSLMIDAVTPADPSSSSSRREIEALRHCVRDRCSVVASQPELFSSCVLEKCIGVERHLLPVSAMTSSRPQHSGIEGSGSTKDRNEVEWRQEQRQKKEEDSDGQLGYNGRRHDQRQEEALMLKRGYTDATDICIAFHCSSKTRGTFGFLKCVNDNRCSGR